jgi:ribose-phosphate pyrophosphokinase
MKPLIYLFPDDEVFARKLLQHLDAERDTFDWGRFPDRESLITLHGDCKGRDVIIVCTLTDADVKTLPLYFLVATARELGARRVGLVAPYLAYMRQDERFHPGQSRSAHSYAELLSTMFDWLVTVDPHLHRITSLDEIYSIPVETVSAMPAVAAWIQANIKSPVLIGPDSESSQWVDRVAQAVGAPSVILEKVRHGDRHVEVSELDPALVGARTPIVLDDIASSGRTFVEVLKKLSAAGIGGATCIVVHALFADRAEETLIAAGAGRVVSTNTVPHETNAIDVAPLVAAAIARFVHA